MTKYRTAIPIAFLLVLAAGCAPKASPQDSSLTALSKKLGVAVPSGAHIVAYKHTHGRANSMCHETWVIRASEQFRGPDRQVKQNRVKSPLKSLTSRVEQLTNEPADLNAADRFAEYVEWQHGEVMCNMRQANTSNGGVLAVVETVSPH